MDETRHRLHGKLQINTEFGIFLGDTRIRLLEAIAEHGSILQAAKAVPLSYKAAWDAIDTMNNLADQPLVVRSTGGRHGGGTSLTDYGLKVVALYRALESEYQAALDRMTATIAAGDASDYTRFRQLIKRMAMKSSARNQFAGVISGLKKGDVDYEVHLRIDDDNELIAIVTKDSAESLGLAIGMEISALVKSSSVLISDDIRTKTSARNQIQGQITRISDGRVNTEVSIETRGGKTLCAVVTHASASEMGLEVGKSVCAVFKASSIILCHYA